MRQAKADFAMSSNLTATHAGKLLCTNVPTCRVTHATSLIARRRADTLETRTHGKIVSWSEANTTPDNKITPRLQHQTSADLGPTFGKPLIAKSERGAQPSERKTSLVADVNWQGWRAWGRRARDSLFCVKIQCAISLLPASERAPHMPGDTVAH